MVKASKANQSEITNGLSQYMIATNVDEIKELSISLVWEKPHTIIQVDLTQQCTKIRGNNPSIGLCHSKLKRVLLRKT
jgi:hypothetical protein